MDNNLTAMEELKKSFKSVVAAKLLLINEIIKKSEEKSVSNELTNRMVEVQLR